MKKIINKKYISLLLLTFIIIYNLFLDDIDISLDYILILLYFLLNIKELFNFFKENKLLFMLFLIFVLLNLYQIIFITTIASFSEFVYASRFIIFTLFPFVLLISININKYEEKEYKIIQNIFIISLIIILIYGLINYIFEFNLYHAGLHILNTPKGRITSFFNNPNGYALFLLFCLVYFLFTKEINKYLKWFLVLLIIISICLTFGRYIYLLMALTIFFYLIYNLIKIKKDNNSLKNIIIILVITLLTFYLPNNNYMFLSLTYQFDVRFNTNLSKTVSLVTEKVILLPYDTDNELLLERIKNTENNSLSSSSTRSLFKKYALNLYKDNKLVGVGYHNYFSKMNNLLEKDNITYVESHLPHNFYILLLTSTGLIGTIIFSLIILYLLWYIYKNSKFNKYIAILLFVVYLFANIEGDFMLGTYFIFIIIALSMNLEYNNYVNLLKKGV